RVSLRLVSLRLSNIYDGRFRGALALDSAACQHLAQQRLAQTVDELRGKYGRAVLLRGHDFVLRAKNGRGQEPEIQKVESRMKNVEEWNQEIGNQAFVPYEQQHEKASSPLPSPPEEEREKTPSVSAVHGFEARNIVSGDSLPDSNSAKSQIANRKSQSSYVQRQRLGNSFARITASPGVELRFRMELKPPGTNSSGSPQSKTKNQKSKTHPVPLNVHSYYSFLDSTLSPRAIVELAKRYELPAIALTDKNNLHGAVEFAQAAAEAGIKPIIGAELNCHGYRVCL